jgi:hypothetical protein
MYSIHRDHVKRAWNFEDNSADTPIYTLPAPRRQAVSIRYDEGACRIAKPPCQIAASELSMMPNGSRCGDADANFRSQALAVNICSSSFNRKSCLHSFKPYARHFMYRLRLSWIAHVGHSHPSRSIRVILGTKSVDLPQKLCPFGLI